MSRWGRSKFGNIRTSGCSYGYSHRSKLEESVCHIISVREKAGELQHVQHECTVKLSDAKIVYIADFRCMDPKTGEEIYIEAKGCESQRWPIIKKLWSSYGPAPLEIWKGDFHRPFLDEVIVPKKGV